MPLTPDEVEKVNDLFRQIDEKDTQLETKEKLLTEKEILLNKTRVTLNEKQAILNQRDGEIEQLKKEISQVKTQLISYDETQRQLGILNEKVDQLLGKLLSPASATKTTKKPSKITSRTTKSK